MTNKFWKGLRVLLLTGLFSLGLMGCDTPAQKADKLFIKEFPIPIQDYLDFKFLGVQPLNANSPISLDLINRTKDCVVFPHDYGKQIFVYLKNDWSGIPDSVDYPGQTDVTLAPAGKSTSDSVVFVKPNYSSIPLSAYPIQMRIVVAGRLCQNGVPAGNAVADYTDITVNKP
jgi:hypothetical protein